jgi:long-chain acyl-CoA synthetase
MDYRSCPSLPAMFFAQAEKLGPRDFLWGWREGAYRPLNWSETEKAVRDLARGIATLGLEAGDRVVLVSENRPEWLIADLAIMTAGGITVPAYVTNTTTDHLHILTDSGARGAIVSNRRLAERLLPAAFDSATECQWVITVEDLTLSQSGPATVYGWREILEKGAAEEDHVAQWVERLKRADTACFIYTSGTGGVPKGVMLSHGSILCNFMAAYQVLHQIGLSDEVFLSFLPLSHAYEHSAGQFFPLSIGAQIYYATGIEKLLGNLAEARPTIMTAVPRLYEVMHQRIRNAVDKQGGLKKRLFERALALGIKRYRDPRSLGLIERLENAALDHLVRAKVRQRFGGRLKALVSGGAALNPDIGLFFTALGLRILQGYGQTEAAPVVSCNPPGRIKIDTVGPPLEGVEVRIAEDGEVLVRGELVMKGYWRNDEATAAALSNGWLHTGDIGEIDGDGYLKITDRKKDIIVLSGGDNISPARIESLLTLQPEIQQAFVYGDRHAHLVAIIAPDEAFLAEFAKAGGLAGGFAELVGEKPVNEAIGEVVSEVNRDLPLAERIRRFILAREPFSVENGLMTPTLKIRRHAIRAVYGEELEALY